jgi:hypothetical protein
MRRRQFLGWAVGAGVGGAVGAGGYAWAIEPHWTEVVERELPIERLPTALEGVRLVQISDLHVGPRVDDEYLIGCLERIRALRPEILVLTGDVLGYRSYRGQAQYAQLRELLSHLPHGRLATAAVLGNHDYGAGWAQPQVAERVTAELRRAGVAVLRNECLNVRGLDLVGVDDLWAHRAAPEYALSFRRGTASLALCHNPDALDELPWGDYRGFVLAGHTHGGQCRPPFLPPPVLPVRNPRYSAGEIPLADGRVLYINRGLGHLQRIRFNVRPEITLFTLRRARHAGSGLAGA